jgi:hypothetical protein
VAAPPGRRDAAGAVQIALNARGADGSPLGWVQGSATAQLQQLLAHFQGTGEFRAGFDSLVMAMAIRAAIDAVPPQLARDDQFDVAHHGREPADLFLLATRPEGATQGPDTTTK